MDITFTNQKIIFEKELNSLDRFVIDFTAVLNKLNIKYVIVSGYVSILFGRNRSSEDIDLFIEKMQFTQFTKLWEELNKGFECIITSKAEAAYTDYLTNNLAIRFARKGKFIPNMEIKFTKNGLDEWAIENSKEVLINNHKLFISSIELQIAFKLYLGSEKDIEDAKYLYVLFKEKLDNELLMSFNRKLNISSVFNRYLK